MSENLGTKIRQLRTGLGLSPAEAAEAAGMETAHLESIENGSTSPAISTMIKIARALGVRVGTILDGTEEDGPALSAVTDGITLNRANNMGTEHSNLNFISLARQKKDRNMDPYIVNIKYKPAGNGNGSTHEGEEFLYVLEGDVELRYGNEVYLLAKGDSIYYDSIVPHTVSSTGPDAQAKVLAVTYTPY